jgi:hypothetical protein
MASERRARATAVIAAALALCALFAGLRWGALVAGGSDSFGYVSQASLWRHGDLLVREPIIHDSPWPVATWTWSPLGYRPSPKERDAVVPIYAPGLPILMALFQAVGGFCGAFVITPLAGALTIWCTYLLGRRTLGSPSVALGGALLIATSPVFLFQLMNAMSDVPVTAACMAALVLVVAGQSLAGGLVTAVAIAIRPNLAPLAIVPFLWIACRDRHAGSRVMWRSLSAYALGVTPVVVGVAALYHRLYESAWTSGYGPLSGLYALRYFPTNVRQFTAWTAEAETPIVALSLMYFILPGWFGASRAPHPRLLLGGMVALVVLGYLFYQPFDAWWYLRFLLPAWPIVMLLTAAAIDALARRWLTRAHAMAAVIVVAGLAAHGLYFARAQSAFDLAAGERRYALVGNYVARFTEPGAVMLSMQHSGSLRLYGNRLTLRYDILDPAWLDRALDHLQATGHRPYLVLDEWEVKKFVERFGGTSRIGALDWPPLATFGTTGIYDPLDTRPARPLRIQPPSGHGLCDVPQGWPALTGVGPL